MNKPMTDDLNAFAANDGHATETRLEAAQTDLTTNVAADRQAHNLKVVGSNPTPATIKDVPPPLEEAAVVFC
jgi:hypothetical protein